ncbi:unnamed protein product, partial [Rotaria sp. Silwood1]
TLLPIIQNYILPGNVCNFELFPTIVFLSGTTIHSDQWRAYNDLQNDPNYQHLTVNHSLNFVDPDTGVHTQNIENTWMRVKRKQKKQAGFARTLLTSYLEEFMWRQEFGDQPLKNLILQICSHYPVQ